MGRKAKVRRIRVRDTKLLYEACKCWRDEDAMTCSDPATLAEVWDRATIDDKMGSGRRFMWFVLRNFKLAQEYGEE